MTTKHVDVVDVADVFDVAVIGGGAARLSAAVARLLGGLGLEPVPHPHGWAFGERIESGPAGQTVVPGVWVAGNVTGLQGQVITAAARGLMAGAAVNAGLVAEDTQRAVEEARAHALAGADRR